MFQAKKAIQQSDECILVEGYADVISLHQAGVENVVASSGTALTVEQIRMIKRFTPNIKIVYDGDAAGIKAALRGLDMVLEEDMNVRIALLPPNEDPDSLIQRIGTTAFREFVDKNAKDFIFFKTQLLLEEAAGDPVKKAKLIKDIVTTIAKIPDPVKRQLYIRECSGQMKVEEAILVGETGKLVRKSMEDKKKGTAAPQASMSDDIGQPTDNQQVTEDFWVDKKTVSTGGDEFQERDIARLIIASGGELYDVENNQTVANFIISNIEEVMHEFDNKLYQKVVQEALGVIQSNKLLNAQFFLGHDVKEIRELASSVLSNPFDYSDNWLTKFGRPLETQKMPELNFTMDSLYALKRFKLRKIMRLCDQNQDIIKKSNDSNDVATMMRHLKIQQKLLESRNVLAKELNTVILK